MFNGISYTYYVFFASFLKTADENTLIAADFAFNIAANLSLNALPFQFFYRHYNLLGLEMNWRIYAAVFAAVSQIFINAIWVMQLVIVNNPTTDMELIKAGCDMKMVGNHLVFVKQNDYKQTYFTFQTANIAVCYGAALYIAASTFTSLKKLTSTMSPRTKLLNRRVNRMQFVQIVMPFTLNAIPLLAFALSRFLSPAVSDAIALYRVFGVGLSPLVDPIVIIIVFPSFRRHLSSLFLFRKMWKAQENSVLSVQTTSGLR
ncbi:unnamed protein product [Bursaphelenchus xylophilus]|nr:unnamed protein product [Bursaphelenchus xylophilus]CAG9100497.1 unnamed protein product [Bursaphelenchus xylophilus]